MVENTRTFPSLEAEANTSDADVTVETAPDALESASSPPVQSQTADGVETATEGTDGTDVTPKHETPKEKVFTQSEVSKIESSYAKRLEAERKQRVDAERRAQEAAEKAQREAEDRWLRQMDEMGQGNEAKVVVERDRALRQREAVIAQREAVLQGQVMAELPNLYVRYAKETYGVEIDPKELHGIPPQELEAAGFSLVVKQLKTSQQQEQAKAKEAATPPVRPARPSSGAGGGIPTELERAKARWPNRFK